MDSSISTCSENITPLQLDERPLEFQPIVQELVDKIRQEGWGHLFEDAIRCARKINLPQIRHIVSLRAYYADMNELLSWTPRENAGGDACYSRIASFYYILNQPSLSCLQSGYSRNESQQPLTWLSQWLPRYSRALGRFHDSPQSISAESLDTFRKCQKWHLEDYVEPKTGFKNFNEFFSRKIKRSLRPIDNPSNPLVIVSPADCRLEGSMWICEESSVTIKHIEWNVERLIGDSNYKSVFRGGLFLHASLAPHDYHRFHAPLAGTVMDVLTIPGQVALRLLVKYDEQGVAHLDFREAMDSPGFQAAQGRGVMILETDIGIVAVAAIGMAQVSSVVMTIQRGHTLQKGDEMGYFQYGGSDIVLMFEKSSNVHMSAQIGDYWKMGGEIARADLRMA